MAASFDAVILHGRTDCYASMADAYYELFARCEGMFAVVALVRVVFCITKYLSTKVHPAYPCFSLHLSPSFSLSHTIELWNTTICNYQVAVLFIIFFIILFVKCSV